MLDTGAFIGGWPWRHVATRGGDDLLRAMDRTGIEQAWVSHLPSVLYTDPRPGNDDLVRAVGPHAARLRPVPTVLPGLPGCEDDLRRAADTGAPAVRAWPVWHGVDPAGHAMQAVVAGAAARALPLILGVRLEDARQRHFRAADTDLPAAAVRTLVRTDPGVKLLVTGADRSFIEEVHFGSTPDEARRLLWDCTWVWGPPEDHLALLIDTLGAERFAVATGWPLRLPEAAVAKIELLDVADDVRRAIATENVDSWVRGEE